MGCQALLQGIFPTRGSNQHLSVSPELTHLGSPFIEVQETEKLNYSSILASLTSFQESSSLVLTQAQAGTCPWLLAEDTGLCSLLY